MSLNADQRQALLNAINQSSLEPDQKSSLMGLLNEKKRYGLVWEDKPEDAFTKMLVEIPVLKEVPDRKIVGNTDDSPNHILIEGDNLHALTAMQYTHAGKVDVIYIDPPYNTGNKDFTYNDSFVDKEDTWRHSKWLSFMEKRLRLAKVLLKESGVIFISIDDNEQAQLKLLCDEVFGNENFIASVLQKSRDSIGGDLLFSRNHNYLHVYAQSFQKVFSQKDSFKIPSDVDERSFINRDNDPRGPWKLHPVDGPGGAAKGNPYYAFLGIEGYYRYAQVDMQKMYDDGLIIKRGKSIGKKYFLSQALQRKGDVATTWWDDVGTTTQGTKLLQEIFGQSPFSNPKPIDLIRRCLQLASNQDSLILDFFAGSGTTLHATMALNAEDGGKRQCILVTSNENQICEQVTYERNKRVIQGYINSKGQTVAGLSDNTLHYYKVDFVERETTLKSKRKLVQNLEAILQLKDNAFKVQTDLQSPLIRVWESTTHLHFLILDVSAIEDVVSMISGQKKSCKVYVFSPAAYPFADDFESVENQVELVALPEAYLSTIEGFLPKLSLLSQEGAE